VLDAGAARVAVVRAILDARDPAEAARALAGALASAPRATSGEIPALAGMTTDPRVVPAEAGTSSRAAFTPSTREGACT